MDLRAAYRRTLVAHARPEAFAIGTRVILGRLGYEILESEDFEARHMACGPDGVPALDLRLVDDRRIGEVDEAPGGCTVPLVVLTGRHGVTGADPRIVGAVKRPAGLHDLYRVLQEVFEDPPRGTPRVAIHLPCVCEADGHSWKATLLSLSENGALLRSPEPLPLGCDLTLRFSLPRMNHIELMADAAYQLPPDIGVVFHAARPPQREAIRDFVVHTLS